MHDSAAILARFNRLMRDIEQGETKRNAFQPWEVELLLDLEEFDWNAPGRRRLWERYCRAVERKLTAGEDKPLKFSEYLASTGAASRYP
jgi:hypothetical protein